MHAIETATAEVEAVLAEQRRVEQIRLFEHTQFQFLPLRERLLLRGSPIIYYVVEINREKARRAEARRAREAGNVG